MEVFVLVYLQEYESYHVLEIEFENDEIQLTIILFILLSLSFFLLIIPQTNVIQRKVNC